MPVVQPSVVQTARVFFFFFLYESSLRRYSHKLGHFPLTAITASIIVSSPSKQYPNVLNIVFIKGPSLSFTAVPVENTEAPSLIMQGVLGMARTTLAPTGSF